MGLLVVLSLSDSGGDLLGLSLVGLQGGNPSITLSLVGGLEGVLVSGNGEVEDGVALSLYLGDLRLQYRQYLLLIRAGQSTQLTRLMMPAG